MVKIAIVIYSAYGHVLELAKSEVEGAKEAGATVDVFQMPSGDPSDASGSSGLPLITPSKLAEYDGVLFGIPSRYGTHPYAFKAFFDATGGQWASGSYYGKYAGFFVTSGTQGGGQESVVRNSLAVLVHHGFIYVPLGYARAFGEVTDLNEVHGGSPWGAGSFAGPSGSRQPSKLEKDLARIQGKSFVEVVARSTLSNNSSAVPVAPAADRASSAPVVAATTDSQATPVATSTTDSTAVPAATAKDVSSTAPVALTTAGSSVAPLATASSSTDPFAATGKSVEPVALTNSSTDPLGVTTSGSSTKPVALTSSSTDPLAATTAGSSSSPVAEATNESSSVPVTPSTPTAITTSTGANAITSAQPANTEVAAVQREVSDTKINASSIPDKNQKSSTNAEDRTEEGGCCKCVVM